MMNREYLLEREMLGQPVRSLQHMLRRLALEYPFLPEVVPDGIFGERTLEAVMLFQRELHPPVTGIVDRDTWNAIRDRWYEVERKHGDARSLRAFPSEGAAVEPGEEQEFIILPQMMFQLLSRYLTGFSEGEASGVHDEDSVRNTKWLQRAAGLEETGTMDRQTWEVLSRLYELFVVRGPEYEQRRFLGGWG